jgi:magnesium transporter
MVSHAPIDSDGRPDTAMQHMCSHVPTAAANDLVATVLDGMRGHQFDCAAAVVVLDGAVLLGLVTIEKMFAAAEDTFMTDIMDGDPPVVTPDTDQEQAAWQAVQRNEPTLAVVDTSGRFHGLVPPQQLLSVLLNEHNEDMARLGGYLHSVESTRMTTVESVRRRLWHRLPWLVLGLVGAMVSAGLMSAFEAQLNATLAIAYFVPGIVYLADAVGTQTETMAIRGLSVGVGIRRILGSEALTGLLVGLLLGTFMLPLVGIMTGDWLLAIAVGVAVLSASSIATVVALLLPWILQSLGQDPAFGSGPLATVIQDLLSILIYLGVVTVLLT